MSGSTFPTGKCAPIRTTRLESAEIFGGSTWAEVAMMLTYADLPGIYVQPDTGLLSVFDHVEAALGRKEGADVLTITNPTKFHASVKVFAEPSYKTAIPLGALAMHGCPRAEVAPGATVEWKIPQRP